MPASTGFVHQQETESGADMLNEFIIICSVKDENTRLSGSYLDTGFKFKTKKPRVRCPSGSKFKKVVIMENFIERKIDSLMSRSDAIWNRLEAELRQMEALGALDRHRR